MSQEIQQALRDALFELKPDEYATEYMGTYEGMIENYPLIIGLVVNDETFAKVLDLVYSLVKTRKKINKVKLLKILRHLLRNNPGLVCKPEAMGKLFELYQMHVGLSTYSNIVNGCIKGRKLNEEQIAWLVENADADEHSLNRLLRFPYVSENLARWAKETFRLGEYPKRISEVLAIIITNDKEWGVLKHVKDIPTRYWALYHATIPVRDKEQALEELFDPHFAHEWADICVRLELSSLLGQKLKLYDQN